MIAAASYSNHAEFVCDDCILDIPFLNSPDFLEKFISIIKSRDIDYVIPTDDTAALYFQEYAADIPAVIVSSPYETSKLCRHKSVLYERLKDEQFTPKIYSLSDIENIIEYPVFIKPDDGQGSKGTRVIESREEFNFIEDLDKMIICEYLPGEEYTLDCFTNKKGELIFCNPRVRTRLMNGITAHGSNISYTDEFKVIINKLNSLINFRGYWYVQLKRDGNSCLKLLEISTRFAGTFAISKGKGINLPLLALCDFSGLDTCVVENNYVVECDKTYIDRYKLHMEYKHLYIDYDDTITSNNGQCVNSFVMAYLYQCRTKGIKISLITRHFDTFKEKISDSLRRLCISEYLFDEIIELTWEEEKYDHIDRISECIFIDNSFDERKKVHDELGIPVFDVSNTDCLFDWRL